MSIRVINKGKIKEARDRTTSLASNNKDFIGQGGKTYAATFNRVSPAWKNGVSVPANTPRVYGETSKSPVVLYEGSRTNLIKNSQLTRTSDTVLPTGWSIQNSFLNVSYAYGTDPNGLKYLEITFSGTGNAGAQFFNLYFEGQGSSGLTGTANNTFTLSLWHSQVSGPTTNVSFGLHTWQSSGAYLGQISGGGFTPTALSTSLTRQSSSGMLNNVSGATYVTPRITVQIPSNENGVVRVIRIALPQFEFGSFMSSYIPTTNASVNRNVEYTWVSPMASVFEGKKPFTVALAYWTAGVEPTAYPTLMSASTSGTNEIWWRPSGLSFHNGAAGALNWTQSIRSWQVIHVTYDGTTWRAYQNGVLKNSSTQPVITGSLQYAGIGTLSRGGNGTQSGNSPYSYIAQGASGLGIPLIRNAAINQATVTAEYNKWITELNSIALDKYL